MELFSFFLREYNTLKSSIELYAGSTRKPTRRVARLYGVKPNRGTNNRLSLFLVHRFQEQNFIIRATTFNYEKLASP